MVEYINYKKKKYPVRISYYALKMFKKETGKSFEEMDNNMEMDVYETIIYYSLVSGARADEEELDLTKEDMVDVLDECFMDFVKLVTKFFPSPEGSVVKKSTRGERRKLERTATKKE